MFGVNYGPQSMPMSIPTQYNNLPDAKYGTQSPVTLGMPLPLPGLPIPLRLQDTDKQGFGVDLNRDNRYTRGSDAILAMDLNGNGRIDDGEISRSRTLLNAYNGNFDANNDGRTTGSEITNGRRDQAEARRRLGNPGCGGISVSNFAAAGGKVLIDRDRNGSFSPNETFDPYNVPGCLPQSLTTINPSGTTGLRPRDGVGPYAHAGSKGGLFGGNATPAPSHFLSGAMRGH